MQKKDSKNLKTKYKLNAEETEKIPGQVSNEERSSFLNFEFFYS